MSKQKLSLQEQLLKSGLVTSAQAKSVNSDKLKQARQQRSNNSVADDEVKRLALKAQAEKIERDRELNLQRKQQEEQKQIAAQVKQLIEQNRHDLVDDGLPYKFIDNNKIKTLYVSETMRDSIASGRLAIVKLGKKYEVVSAEAAEKIKARNAASVIVLNDSLPSTETKDDPYAAFQVPDDLMW
ncbi:MAG: DUF2058 domain-containing protein [Methylococcaceae bacterium]|nr:DUF2058 domain-containing protein [Methylococcaceae bacterium]